MKLSLLYEDNVPLYDQLFPNRRSSSKKIRDHSNGTDIVFGYFIASHKVKSKYKYKLKVEFVDNNIDDMMNVVIDHMDKPKLVVRIYSNDLEYLYDLQFKIFNRLKKHKNFTNIDDARSLFGGIKKVFNGFDNEKNGW